MTGGGPMSDGTGTAAPAGTPAADGFRMPAEWAPHDRCWMAWPCREEAWPEGLAPARAAYAEVAAAIAAFERVTMIARPEDAAAAARMCGARVEIAAIEIDDSWTRDTGPTFLVDDAGGLAGVDWRFNGWGGIYAPVDRDDALAARILAAAGARRYAAPMVLEGGAIHVDGEGTLLTTEECLLNPNRNPDLDGAEIEALLRAYLGVEEIVWLGRGLADDETSGHVDNVACFVRPATVVVQVPDDPADPNHGAAVDNLARLAEARDAAGRRFEVIHLPAPAPRRERGAWLALSYVNFYIANGGVVMPAFDDPADGIAREILEGLFPDRQVVPVPAIEIARGGGGIHCITQQQPARAGNARTEAPR